MRLLLPFLLFAGLASAGFYFSGSKETYTSGSSDMLQLGKFAYQEKRFEDAFNWYTDAALQGLAEGQFQLAQLYLHAEGVEKDDILATHWLKKAAIQGLAAAEFEYANALEFGRGTTRLKMNDVSPWYLKAAQQGFSKAMLKVARLYLTGNGVDKDFKNALTWALKAEKKNAPKAIALHQEIVNSIKGNAANNDADAQFTLALMYQDGRGVKQDLALSKSWLEKAAKNKNIDAQYILGKVLATSQNWAGSLFWLQKAAVHGHKEAGYTTAALLASRNENKVLIKDSWRWLYHGMRDNNPKTLYNLAIILNSGRLGLPKTDFNYQLWLQKAAQVGIISAQNDLGVYLKLHHQESSQASMRWLRKAAFKDAEAQFNLGLIYARGEGITPNDDKAIHWWKKAAQRGSPHAEMMLGLFYNLGRGVGRSEQEAVNWYLKAAKFGNTNAIYNLAVLYYNGLGIDRNYEQAAKYFSILAKQGNTDAQNIYGSLFLEGQGVSFKPQKAIKWFKKSASANNVKAMFNLATQYRQGNGVAQNDKKAIYWYKKAAELSFAPAQNALGYMYAEGRGTKLSKKWAEEWFFKASENGLALAKKNLDALDKGGDFSLVTLQIDNQIRSDVLTNQNINLAQWLEVHHTPLL